ncbi:MAG: hypothetical protein KKA73_21800 [Chloroflexi bacterium]|nr:hypothetical protein [Chloroflexota bacterium]MBU1750329.1 hypothetical protein [Chloroflexota bacterium]
MKDSRRPGTELLMELGAFAILVASVSLLWRDNLLLFIVMLIECPIALILWHDRLTVCFFLIIGVLGTLAEGVFIQFGVWQYNNPTFLGVPLWFPLAFGTTGLIGSRLAQTLVAIWDRVSPPTTG